MGSARTGSNPVVIAFRSDVVGFFFDKRKETARRDTVAERLRRRPAKPLGSARVGSNPIGVVLNDWRLLINYYYYFAKRFGCGTFWNGNADCRHSVTRVWIQNFHSLKIQAIPGLFEIARSTKRSKNANISAYYQGAGNGIEKLCESELNPGLLLLTRMPMTSLNQK